MNPHCPDCIVECKSCESLLAFNRELLKQNQLLVSALIQNNTERAPSIESKPENLEPIRSGVIPWKVRREMLEKADKELKQNEDRDTAKKVRNKIEELEAELLTEIPEHPLADSHAK